MFGTAVVAGLIWGVAAGLLGLIRSKGGPPVAAAVWNAVATFLLVWLFDWGFLFFHRPAMIFSGLIAAIFANFVIMFIVALIGDGFSGSLDATAVVAVLGIVAFTIVWVTGYNSGHDAHKAAYGFVHVTTAANDDLPASTTS